MGSFTLQMLALPHQMHCLSLIRVCDTICLNGIMAQIMHKSSFHFFLKSLTYDILQSPCNPKELFNLCYALARNVIEWIFGVLKCRFQILQIPAEYDMRIQVLILPVLAALHNFIREYNPEDIQTYNNEDDEESVDWQIDDYPKSVGSLGSGMTTPAEKAQASERQDKIAANMWEQYQHYLQNCDT